MAARKILITGSNGFLGKNLMARLKEIGETDILAYDINNAQEDLERYAKQADFVFHLAAVNRAAQDREYMTGNKAFTEKLADLLQRAGKKASFLYSSSVQAALDNPYGKSKKLAEDAVFSYGAQSGARVYVYRFPNLFGKWSRPEYNSVVATFCHNIARGLPITVKEPDRVLTLAHVDDAVRECIDSLYGKTEKGEDGFYHVSRTHKASVGELSQMISSFKGMRETGRLPDLSDGFIKALYSTYQSYLPEDDHAYRPKYKTDNRGSLAELLKSEYAGQVFVSTTKPGIIRGNHYHHVKIEKFIVLNGNAAIRLRRIDGSTIIEYHVSGDDIQVVEIPPGYTHHIENTGKTDLVTLFWANEIFDADNPDTYFQPV